jgi:GT2 family glycosyltransferase
MIEPMVYILIPVHNRIALTVKCLNSLIEQKYKNFTVIIVDDGSIDNTSEIVSNQYHDLMRLQIIHGNGSLWWAGAIKVGVDYAINLGKDDDLVMTLNNDVTLFPGFLQEAINLYNKYPAAFIGGVSVDNDNLQEIIATGWKMICWPLAYTRRVWWPATLSDLCDEPEVINVDFIPGTATLIPIHLVKKFGTVNPDILPHYHADSEYTYRLKQSGVPVLLSKNLPIYHNVSSTGLIGNLREKPSLLQVLKSFFSIKSGNCLKYKWNFARACCPWWACIGFMVFDTVKVLTRSFGAMVAGERIDNIRIWVNHI